MKIKRLWILFALAPLIIVAIWYVSRDTQAQGGEIKVKPLKGNFEIPVIVPGELEAKNSTEIMGPVRARKLGISQLKISQLVPEGTVVKKGDFVAELDATEILAKQKESELNLQKLESQVTQARLDCTLTLSQARDELINLKFSLEQRKLEKEESIYEAPSTKRASEIEWEKAQRTFDQAKTNYFTRVKQAEAKMRISEADYNKEKQKFDELKEIEEEFKIMAPENGMVIYAREWGGGRKIASGSTVNAWEPTVATLPDLSSMQSKTFVNEVDIQKIKEGQEVVIGLDADPLKKLNGKVKQIANIGQQQSGSDSKVFEVIIEVITLDPSLRPAMTTSNRIIVNTISKVLFIPQETVIWEDTLSFVMKANGRAAEKIPVKLGTANENSIIVISGLSINDEILLSPAKKEESKE